jgi:hypothetical protein
MPNKEFYESKTTKTSVKRRQKQQPKAKTSMKTIQTELNATNKRLTKTNETTT